MIDNALFEDLSGFILDIDVHNTGSSGNLFFDTLMSWFVLGSTETSYTF